MKYNIQERLRDTYQLPHTVIHMILRTISCFVHDRFASIGFEYGVSMHDTILLFSYLATTIK